MTLLALRAVLSQVGSGRVRRAVCGVLEHWLKGVKTYFRSWDKCPFPRIGEAQFCEHVYPLYCYVVQNWLGCEEEEDKQAVLRAVAAMIGVLLHEEQHREYAWDQLVLYQDTFWATKVRQCTGPGVAMGSVQVPQGVGELLGARGAREPLLKEQGEQRSPEASFRQEKSNPGGTQVSLGLISCGGDALPSPWGSGVPEELCPSAQGHVQPCQTQAEVSWVGSHGR
ncbi:maestro heat-like repeat-containing protein family member 2A isoform 1-T1 [Morphnus guianensis]